MSDAFRNPLEASQEKTRRAEERIVELEEEVREVKARLSFGQRPTGITAGFIGTFLVGLVVGGLALRARDAAEARALAARHEAEKMELEANATKLRADHAEQTARLDACTAAMAECRRPPAPSVAPSTFDRGAAVAALMATTSAVKRCSRGTETIHTSILFAPTGEVRQVIVDSPATLNPDERGCVSRAISTARVPPFEGEPVRVGKTFSFDP